MVAPTHIFSLVLYFNIWCVKYIWFMKKFAVASCLNARTRWSSPCDLIGKWSGHNEINQIRLFITNRLIKEYMSNIFKVRIYFSIGISKRPLYLILDLFFKQHGDFLSHYITNEWRWTFFVFVVFLTNKWIFWFNILYRQHDFVFIHSMYQKTNSN